MQYVSIYPYTYSSSITSEGKASQDITTAIGGGFLSLNKAFKEKTSYLSKTETMNVYLLMSYLIQNTNMNGHRVNGFYKWYLDIYNEIQADNEYRQYSSHAVNSRNAILGRFQVLLLYLRKKYDELGLSDLDEQRIFTKKQKKAIFSRDEGQCKNCGKSVNEDNWHADHIVPWIKGGKTIIENGQVLCPKCNLQKTDSLW